MLCLLVYSISLSSPKKPTAELAFVVMLASRMVVFMSQEIGSWETSGIVSSFARYIQLGFIYRILVLKGIYLEHSFIQYFTRLLFTVLELNGSCGHVNIDF